MKKRLLFVDDETAVLQGLKRALRGQSQHWDMQFVDSAAAALDALEREPVDVVITDMRMPEMNGAELLQQLSQRYPQVIRLVLSGHADEALIAQSVSLAHQYLPKPCSVTELKQVVNALFALEQWLPDVAIRAHLHGICHLPMVYHNSEKLEAIRNGSSFELKRLPQWFCEEQKAVIRVLQLANSGFYGVNRNSLNCRAALNQIGLPTLGRLIRQRRILLDPEPTSLLSQGETLRVLRNSLAVARLARQIAPLVDERESFADECYLSGLLHDIGILILLYLYGAEYQTLLSQKGKPLHELERQHFGFSHAEIGAYLIGLWGLPESVMESVAWHHQPSRSKNRQISTLTVLHLADLLSDWQEQGGLTAAEDTATLLQHLDADYLPELDWQHLINQSMSLKNPALEPQTSS